MKTLVVFSALIAATIAAPSLVGEHQDDIKTSPDAVPETIRRDKKSLLEEHRTSQVLGAVTFFEPDNNPELASPAARTFSHKSKPIIIKKKVGYHIYRDSGEEKADSRENCQKEVKVKLCDEANSAKSSHVLRDSANENMSEVSMHRNIEMAKEAVKHLQRDIQEIEENSETTKITGNQGKSKSNAEIREDIEEAKQVLEQIHKNFGLDSMNIHTTTSKDAESIHDIHLTIAQTEEDRMAQWKEALENIQRNVDLVRNIEDSFKPAIHETDHLVENETSPSMKHDSQTNLKLQRTFQAEDQKGSFQKSSLKENLAKVQNMESEKVHERANEKSSVMNKNNNDMDFAATNLEDIKMHQENMSQKSEFNNNDDQKTKLRNPSDIKQEQNVHKGGRFEESGLISMSLKAEEDKNTESSLKSDVKTSSDSHKFKESEIASKMWNHDSDKNTKQELSSWEIGGDQSHRTKSSEQFDGELKNKHFETKKREDVHRDKLVKSANPMTSNTGSNELKNTEALQAKENMDHENLTHNLKSSDSEPKHLALLPSEHVMSAKSMDQVAHQSQQVHTIDHDVPHHLMNTAMKSADSLHRMEPNINGPFDTRWTQDQNMRWSPDKHMMRFDENMAADEHSNAHLSEMTKNMQFMDQPHMVSHTMKSANQHPAHFDTSKSLMLPSQRPLHLHTLKMHGKQSMVDSAMLPTMDMRDAMATFDQSPMGQWKRQQELSRSVYASPMAYPASSGSSPPSSGSGAVGVFPNANTGGCGIPLLLSCSPSVVSGSLAKAHPPSSYAASAYRNEDDFFHTKRDVTNNPENQISKIQRTPATTKSLPLDKQQ